MNLKLIFRSVAEQRDYAGVFKRCDATGAMTARRVTDSTERLYNNSERWRWHDSTGRDCARTWSARLPHRSRCYYNIAVFAPPVLSTSRRRRRLHRVGTADFFSLTNLAWRASDKSSRLPWAASYRCTAVVRRAGTIYRPSYRWHAVARRSSVRPAECLRLSINDGRDHVRPPPVAGERAWWLTRRIADSRWL